MPGEVIAALAERKKQFATYRRDLAGTQFAEVEVDVETGAVRLRRYVVAHDCGKVINPLIVEGQVHGGVAQGVGGALFEEMVYDAQ